MVAITACILLAIGIASSFKLRSNRGRVASGVMVVLAGVVLVLSNWSAQHDLDGTRAVLDDYCAELGNRLRDDVLEFRATAAPENNFPPSEVLRVQSAYMRAWSERKRLIGLCTAATAECLPPTLGRSTVDRVAAAAAAVESKTACTGKL